MEKQKWYEKFQDAAFSLYVESGEARLVHIIRDLAKDVDTSGNWIDILQSGRFWSNQKQETVFWVAAELFPRLTTPVYTSDPMENNYLCWRAAHEDIAEHREKQHHGRKYMVLYRVEKRCEKFPNIGKPVVWISTHVTASRHIRQKDLINPEACARRMQQQESR